SQSQCRMEAPGRARGMRRRHEPRGQPHFVLPPNLYNGPPGRGDFWILKIAHAPSDKNLSKNGSVPIKGVGFSVKDAFAKKFLVTPMMSADWAPAPIARLLAERVCLLRCSGYATHDSRRVTTVVPKRTQRLHVDC